jgi:hypothetical protein
MIGGTMMAFTMFCAKCGYPWTEMISPGPILDILVRDTDGNTLANGRMCAFCVREVIDDALEVELPSEAPIDYHANREEG